MKFFLSFFAVFVLAELAGCHSKTSFESSSEELEMDGIDEAISQEFRMMRDPYLNTVPIERLEFAGKLAMGMRNNSIARMPALTWVERGPNNIGGRTRSIMPDRRDGSGNTVFAGSVGGGIFKTNNFLSVTPAWTPLDDKMLNLAVTAMMQDRTNGAIMYAGTGEGWFNIDAIRGGGIFKSTDGGTSWSRLASTAAFEYVQDLAQDNNGNLYASVRNTTAAGARGVHRSADGGLTWIQVLGLPLNPAVFTTGRAADLEVASNGDIYATLGIFTRTQLFKSSATNGLLTGAVNTWTNITPVHPEVTQRGELAIAPSNPLRLYLLLEDSVSAEVRTIYRSSDGGAVWQPLSAPPALNNGAASQTWYNLIAAVDPANPDILVVGGFQVAKSTDAGNNFTNITPAPSGVHVDQHVLLFNSSSSLIVGNDGGIYHTANANVAAPGFSNKNNGFNVTQFYGADFHPNNPNYFLAGAQDNNTQKFTGEGINSTVPVIGGDGGIPHIDQKDGQLQIAATTNNNFFRSTNGGNNWNTVPGNNNRGLFINPSDLDDNLKTLYAGDNRSSYYYVNTLNGTPVNGTNTLTQIGVTREVSAVKVDPFSNQTVWLAASYSFDQTQAPNAVLPVIIKVANANTSSPNITVSSTVGTITTTNGAYISSVDIDPANANHLLATLSNFGVTSVFESINGGVSWTSIEGDLPDMPVYWGVFAPANAQLNGPAGGEGGILLGTELGVWSTSRINGPATQWIINGTGLPNVRTDMLKIRVSDMLVLAATHGRGLFTTNLPFIAGPPPIDTTKSFIKYTTVDANRLFIKAGNLTTTKLLIRIYDMKGSLVKSADVNYSDRFIQVSDLARGVYILKIYGDKGERYTRQFMK